MGWILVLYLWGANSSHTITMSPILSSKTECENLYKITISRDHGGDVLGHLCVAVTKPK